MNKYYWTHYLPSYPRMLVYMLQSSEYNLRAYWQWVLRADDMRVVAKRGGLDMTIKAVLLYLWLIFVAVVLGLLIAVSGYRAIFDANLMETVAILVVVVVAPWVVAISVLLPVWLGETFVQKPRQHKIIARTAECISAHPGHKIAIAGSYGKTSMKEMLKTILSVKLDTAATPGNLNTPLGTAKFAGQLSGEEDVVIFELGESRVGDVAELCNITQPDEGIITGVSEAHLESFGSVENIVDTVLELAEYLGEKPVYKNGESELVAAQAEKDAYTYSVDGVGKWRVSDVTTDIHGTAFTATRGKTKLSLHSGLLGEYQVGPIMACVDIAHRLGLSVDEIEEGVACTKPFAHRMQPRRVVGGWVIDDTYNGNPSGVEAGLDFLKNIDAKRKVYVTPGLVEQGQATERVHIAIGEQAAFCDEVVLMQNSTTEYIKQGLEKAKFAGTLTIIDNPLAFYQNIANFVADGDVVLMQNDWPDNYV